MPIVFAQGVDPVGSFQVASLARPGGNTTGFTQFEYGLSAKWLELLKETAPRVARVGVLRESGVAAIGQWAVIQAAASPLGVEASPIQLRDAGGIERDAVATLKRGDDGTTITVRPSRELAMFLRRHECTGLNKRVHHAAARSSAF